MGFLEYGSVRGLSLGHDYQRDIDRLYDRERYSMEVRKERENKARYYGEMLQQKQATTPYNTQRLEGYYDELSSELADFVINNPNFETDINLQRQFQNIAGRFQDNDIIREDMQVAQALEGLKNETLSGEMDGEDYIIEMDRYMEYANNGGDPYVFENFKKVYLTDIVTQLADEVAKVTDITTEDGQVISTVGADPAALDYTARMALTRSDYDRTVEKAWRKAEGSGMYDNKLDFLKTVIQAQVDYGKEHVAWDQSKLIDARTRAALQTEQVQNNPLFGNYVLEPLYSDKRSVTADNRHIAFTPWRTKGATFNPGTFIDSGGNKFKTLFLNTLKTGEDDPNYVQIELNETMAATGAGRIFLDDFGKAFVEVDVQIPVLEGENKPLRDQLEKYGWSSKKYSEPGVLVSALREIEGITQTSDVYNGTIVVPASFDPAQIHDYELGYKTQTKAMEMQSAYKPLATQAQLMDAASRLSVKYPNSGNWRKAVGSKGETLLVSSDGRYVHNISTNETVSR